MYVFPGEISAPRPISFAGLQKRLLERLRRHLREGMATERGLARASGLSQPHVHNLLKGVRAPTIESSDALLGVLDSATIAELFRFDVVQPPPCFAAPLAGVPMLAGVARAGVLWVDGWSSGAPFPFPCSALTGLREPAALRVERDTAMRLEAGVVAVDCGFDTDAFPVLNETYVVVVGGCGVIRRLRPGRDCLYVVTEADLDYPASWVRVARDTRVVARLKSGAVVPYDSVR